MALRMASLKTSKSGELIARKAIPADVRAQYKLLHGLSRWYSWFVERHQSDLRSPTHWSSQKDHFIWQVLAPHAPDEHHEPYADPSWPWVNRPEVRAATAGQVREIALTASFLASEGIALTADADVLFVAAVRDNLPGAYDVLERQSWGDHSVDRTPETFPTYQDAKRTAAAAIGRTVFDLSGY